MENGVELIKHSYSDQTLFYLNSIMLPYNMDIWKYIKKTSSLVLQLGKLSMPQQEVTEIEIFLFVKLDIAAKNKNILQ